MKTYRPKYHIAPATGWINDPNGFCFFKGQYHLFTQHNPHGLSWGPMHWLHFVSSDLVHFEEVGIALYPDQDYDREFGCFSGSAITLSDALHLYYTGVNNGRQTQCLATSNDGLHFEKYEGNPIVDKASLPGDYLESDFRDPKVFLQGDELFMIVSARHKSGYGSILLFKGETPTRFVFVSVLASFEDLIAPFKNEEGKAIRGMCECPDILFFGEEVALISSLQFKGREKNSFQNVHSVVYAFGHLDLKKGEFIPSTPYRELDHGFDVYATQTLEKDGKHYLVYWENMWDDRDYLDRKEGYCGALSSIHLVRKEGDRLVMDWLPALKEEASYGKLEIKVLDKENALHIGSNIRLRFDKENQTATISRVNLDEPICFHDGSLREERVIDLHIEESLTLEYCIDRSCAELSFNGGEASFSMRIYGYSDSDDIATESHGLEVLQK